MHILRTLLIGLVVGNREGADVRQGSGRRDNRGDDDAIRYCRLGGRNAIGTTVWTLPGGWLGWLHYLSCGRHAAAVHLSPGAPVEFVPLVLVLDSGEIKV